MLLLTALLHLLFHLVAPLLNVLGKFLNLLRPSVNLLIELLEHQLLLETARGGSEEQHVLLVTASRHQPLVYRRLQLLTEAVLNLGQSLLSARQSSHILLSLHFDAKRLQMDEFVSLGEMIVEETCGAQGVAVKARSIPDKALRFRRFVDTRARQANVHVLLMVDHIATGTVDVGNVVRRPGSEHIDDVYQLVVGSDAASRRLGYCPTHWTRNRDLIRVVVRAHLSSLLLETLDA